MTDRHQRRKAIIKAVIGAGYRQQEVAEHLGPHYSTISRILSDAGSDGKIKNKDLTP